MTLDHLANLFMNWGFVIDPKGYEEFSSYLKEMLRRNRVFIIWNGPLIEAVITFYLSNEYEKYLYKPLWEIPEGDDPNGNLIIIDKMICRNWKLPLRRLLQTVIEENFPNVIEGHYYHAPLGPHVKIKRRRPLNVIQSRDTVGCGV